MLKELFEAIGDMAVKAARSRVEKAPAEPAHIYHVLHADGRIDRKEADPAPRDHKAGDVEALCQLAVQHEGVVWFSRAGAVLICDDDTRRDRVTMPLALHPQLKTCHVLEANQQLFSQREFVSLLRVSLAGCTPPTLVEVVRRVKFRVDRGGSSEVGHGKSSIDKSIKAELTGSGDIPETVPLSVPAFAGPLARQRFRVECAVEVHADTEKFQLIPLPGAVEGALCEAEDWLGQLIRDAVGDDATVHYGQP